jgi:putative MATE family efflux protein
MAKVDHITEGPIYPTIFRLAWPVLTSMLLEFTLSLANYFWVGFLGTAEQDAVTSSMIVTWSIFSTIAILVTGINALVSRAIGANDKATASYVSKQGIWLGIITGLFFSTLGIILTPHIMVFLKASPEVAALGTSYLQVFFISIGFIHVNDSLGAIFRASGDTRSPMYSYLTATILNIILDPFLIFGWGPFPKMGIAGAATATVISVIVGCLIFIFLILKNRLEFSLAGWHKIRPDFKMMAKIIKIGLPISIQNLTFTLIYWFLIQIVHQYGDAAGAAMGIGNRMEAMSYLVAFGFSIAASTLVGQNLGAKQPERAEKCAWGVVKLVVIETAIVSAIFLTIPGIITNAFTSDPNVHKIASDYLFILGLSQVFMGIEIVLEGAFSGAGNTIPPMAVSIPWSIARLPLAYLFCFTLDMGINGVWWSLTITSFCKAIILFFWFRKGNWKKKML